MATKEKVRKTIKGNVFTKAWKSATGKEVAKGDHVKAKDGDAEGIVVARHTRPKDREPMVLIELAGAAASGTAKDAKGKGKGKGKSGPARTSIPASEVVHVKGA